MTNVLRCSSAGRWTRCAMSAHLERHPDAIVDEDQDAAEEGTAAAWAAETVINGDATCMDDMLGKVHQNGVEINEDMARHLTDYVALAAGRIRPKAEVFRSTPVANDWVIGGTLDLEGWSSPEDYHIDDLKYGFRVIEPTSRQVWSYAALAYLTGVRATRWHLGIYQPRAIHHLGPYRTVTASQDDVVAYANWMLQVGRQIAAGENLASPGDQCMNCLGAAKCEALTQSIYAMWTPICSRAILDPSDQQIADELTMLQQMKSMVTARQAAVEAEATERSRRGRMIPGWAMMPRPGQRKFKFPGDVVHMMTGVDPYVVSVCTPAELERRGASKVSVNALSSTPVVGYKLAPYDPRTVGALFGEKKK